VRLIGRNGDATLDFKATAEIRLKNTLEVALVLDNSGSMDQTGSGSGKKRLALLKDASKELVDALAAQASNMRQIDKPVQFAVVPFAASVNVGSGNKTMAWMDQDGLSPVHHEIFNWAAFTSTGKKVEQVGGVYYKKGPDWGTQENHKVTRFTLFDEVTYASSRTWVPNNVCTEFEPDSSQCRIWEDRGQYSYAY
jgi:hypothetical protein